MYKNFRMGISELSKRRNFSELVRISFWEKSNNLRFVYIANTIFIYFLIEYSNYYLLFTSSIRKKNTHTHYLLSLMKILPFLKMNCYTPHLALAIKRAFLSSKLKGKLCF